LIRIEANQQTREEKFESARNQLLAIPGVVSVSKSTLVPGDAFSDTSSWSFQSAGETYKMVSVKVSTGYFNTLQASIVRGRDFLPNSSDEATRNVIINESAAQKMTGKDPIGQFIHFPGCDTIPMQIVGIVKDFNVQDLSQSVRPMLFSVGNKACAYQSGGAILVRLRGGQLQSSLAQIHESWKHVEPDFPLRYRFLNDDFQRLYASQIRLHKIVRSFAVIAMLISLMGLFALTVFLTAQRAKEIGIRKVLGAGSGQLAVMLTRSFLLQVMIALLIAVPVGWWAAHQWLQQFAYRTSLNWTVFATGFGILIGLSALTVSLQVFRAATANPVKSLRTE
jgi:putative ABC transport system permease protein